MRRGGPPMQSVRGRFILAHRTTPAAIAPVDPVAPRGAWQAADGTHWRQQRGARQRRQRMPPATSSDAATLARDFDLRHLSPAFYADPYPVYHALRSHEPVKRMPDGSLILTRFRDVQAVYRDPTTFSSDKTV